MLLKEIMKTDKEFLREEITRLSLLARHCKIEDEQDRYIATIKSLIESASKDISPDFSKELERIKNKILIQC